VIGTGRKKGVMECIKGCDRYWKVRVMEGIKGCDRYWKEERGDGWYKRL
jgi:hypothetical protein